MKYLLLFITNVPLILVGIIGAYARYKNKRISKKSWWWQFTFWLIVAVGLAYIEPIYNWLIRSNLTDSPPMTIFDMVLLTLVLFCLLLIKSANEKITDLNRKVTRMHEEIVISRAINKE